MKSNIILSGVGGQGILTIAAIIDTATLASNLNIKQSEVHGMSQRGGAVQSHVRISDKEIYSDLIPKGKADVIISVEPMELLRYLPFLKKKGFLITDSNPFLNITNYPELKDLYAEIQSHPNTILIDAKKIAKDLGNAKATNIVLLGAASSLLPLSKESLKKAIKNLFERKGEKIVTKNLEAFEKGKEIASSLAV
ncbi:indolepyruvate oxidoreductase subunit beta [Lutibacter sp. TH_r2]|uniref:indolepyruvate oxidoreductase subunit beta n=1 Tax=Lutibacter sp. TH_r2 TaxID=3082083 RepID=UPI002954384A|nr:indolepyruvate oxidoreductase subunit beta [Lutibacter sp. TH_r2]MDV7187117.1 indolepyruvate oxidoreductase subunit beta [Lutibacter sp. TH_r2]